MKKLNKNKLFYIAIAVCAVAVITTGYVVSNNMKSKIGKNNYQLSVKTPEQTPAPVPTVSPKTSVGVSNEVKNIPKETKKPVPKSTPVATEDISKQVAAVNIDNLKFDMPVSGKIVTPHSNDTLVYWESFDDWRVHNGVDIETKDSEQVKAVADGVIEKVYIDNMMGIVIEINHGMFSTVYCGVSTDQMAKEGSKVKKGDIISGIGNTSIAESYMSPHLHFELKKDGKNIDPAPFFK